MNVLIVDDHPMMLEYLSSAVAKALPDAVVRTAGDLTTALERAREIEPKLVLVDLGLPGCGGIGSVLQFRAAFPQVPTVVVSANDDSLSVRGAARRPTTTRSFWWAAASHMRHAAGTATSCRAISDTY